MDVILLNKKSILIKHKNMMTYKICRQFVTYFIDNLWCKFCANLVKFVGNCLRQKKDSLQPFEIWNMEWIVRIHKAIFEAP